MTGLTYWKRTPSISRFCPLSPAACTLRHTCPYQPLFALDARAFSGTTLALWAAASMLSCLKSVKVGFQEGFLDMHRAITDQRAYDTPPRLHTVQFLAHSSEAQTGPFRHHSGCWRCLQTFRCLQPASHRRWLPRCHSFCRSVALLPGALCSPSCRYAGGTGPPSVPCFCSDYWEAC
jgi:hypothetical protein